MTDATPAPLRDRVASATNAVLKLANDASANDLVDRITLEAQLWSRPDITVVVAGEASVGKTSLVNSLLARPLLPRGDAAAGGRFAVVRSGADGARVHLGDAAEPKPIELSEIPAWLGPAPPGDAMVRGIDVLVDHTVLAEGLVLVDTPAIGSVDDAEVRITLSTLAAADAVLFVADAGRPLSATSLAFLEEATTRIETVIVALTKTDRFRGWREVAGDDRRAIDGRLRALREPPIVPVSNRLKELGDATGDDALIEESGVPRLLDEIHRLVIDRKQRVRLANLLRVDSAALDDLDRRLARLVDAGATPSAVQAQVAVDEQALEDLRTRAEQVQILVTDGFATLRDTATAAANLALRDLSGKLLAKAKAKEKLPVAGLADLELRAVDADLAELIDGEARRIGEEVSALLSVRLGLPTAASPLVLGEVPRTGSGVSEEVAAKLRVSVAGALASSGSGLALLASRIASAAAPDVLLAVFGASATVGVVVAGMNLRLTKRQADLQAVRREIQTIVEAVRTSAQPSIRQRVLASQRALEAAIRAEVRSRTRELQAAVADGTRLAKADAAERSRVAAASTIRREELARVRTLLDGLVVEVSDS